MAVKIPENLRDLIELNLEERPDQSFVFWRDEEISFRTLNERANQVANGLRSLGGEREMSYRSTSPIARSFSTLGLAS